MSSRTPESTGLTTQVEHVVQDTTRVYQYVILVLHFVFVLKFAREILKFASEKFNISITQFAAVVSD